MALRPPAKRVGAPNGEIADDVHLAVIGREARRQYMLPLAASSGLENVGSNRTLHVVGERVCDVRIREPLFSGLLDDVSPWIWALSAEDDRLLELF